MKIKTAWAIQSLALCVLFNLAFAALLYSMASGVIQASHQWISALDASWKPAMSPDGHKALGGLVSLVAQSQKWLIPALAVLASAFTLLQWFFLFLTGSRHIRRSEGAREACEAGGQASDAHEAQAGSVESGRAAENS